MTDLEAIGKACFALHARMTARLLSRVYDGALRPTGLKLPQFGILGAIGHGTPVSETALAERLGLERTTLVRNLKTLVDRGWVEPVPGDGRGLGHRLTPPAGQPSRPQSRSGRRRRPKSRSGSSRSIRRSARRAMRALRKASADAGSAVIVRRPSAAVL